MRSATWREHEDDVPSTQVARLKSDWESHLHSIRSREFDLIFGRFPVGAVGRALEVGAGDGFQSHLLAQICREVVASDIAAKFDRLGRQGGPDFRQVNAEEVGQVFPPRSFDLVFSSSVLFCLDSPAQALEGTRSVLRPGGLAIHVLPSPFWKLTQVALHIPNLAAAALRRVLRRSGIRGSLAAIRAIEGTIDEASPQGRPRRSVAASLLWAKPAGAARTNLEELWSSRRSYWIGEFQASGFELVKTVKGPVMSGYGFGWDALRRRLESLGFSSEWVYISRLPGAPSPLERWLP